MGTTCEKYFFANNHLKLASRTILGIQESSLSIQALQPRTAWTNLKLDRFFHK